MGTYDTFESKDGTVQVQLKAGACAMLFYKEGDPCPKAGLQDGVYESSEGFVAIFYQKVYSVTKEDPKLQGLPKISKWGDRMRPGEKLADHDYVARAVQEAANEVIQEAVLDHAAAEARQKVFGGDSILPVLPAISEHVGEKVQDRFRCTDNGLELSENGGAYQQITSPVMPADQTHVQVSREMVSAVFKEGCFFCDKPILNDTENWPVKFCASCVLLQGNFEPLKWTPWHIEKVVAAAYEAGRASVLGSKLESDEMVEKGMR
jgi:hypothetical protein